MIPPKPRERIGFYGCAADGVARLVRVSTTRRVKGDSSARVRCPVCHLEHPVKIAWRAPVDADEGRQPDLVLGSAS